MAWLKRARDPRQWYLIPLSGSLPATALTAFPVTVGRDVGCDVRVDDPAISGEHLRIEAAGPDLVLVGLGGGGGLAVDGRRVRRARVARDRGADVTVGEVFRFLLRYGTAAEADAGRQAALAATQRPWRVLHGGAEQGPYSDEELRSAARRGQFDPLDEVCHSPSGLRAPAGELPGMRLFPALARTAEAGADLGAGPPQPAQGASPSRAALVCPYCWHRFGLADLLYVAQSQSLRGDPVLGPDQALRFLPTRFDPQTRRAMDRDGWWCAQLACPNCHLALPSQIRHAPVHFLSLVGAPNSGKSVFMVCLSRWLKENMYRFGYHLGDADGTTNSWLNEYERILFHPPDPGEPQTIAKTPLHGGDHYRDVLLDGQTVSLPLPSVFALSRARVTAADAEGACESAAGSAARAMSSGTRATSAGPERACDRALLAFYDNAGEHFLPGADIQSEPGTRHLVCAEGILFLLDPVLDMGLRQAVAAASFEISPEMQTYPQENLITEVFSRIRKHLGLDGGLLYPRPVVVCLSKSDLLGTQVDMGASPLVEAEPGCWALDLDRVVAMSFRVRCLLLRYAPLVVRVLDQCADHVLYVPVSALGHCPSSDGRPRHVAPDTAIRPCDIRPRWVEVPALYLLWRLGHVKAVRTGAGADVPEAAGCSLAGAVLRVAVPGTGEEVEVPPVYGGYAVQAPGSGAWFRVPVWPGVRTF